ncbi:MAG: DUF4281 domain-containing protein [Gemmatirosa sp.]|nr:DUF4281 domain-containing protein [Gemmatirosa sp.]
MSPLSTDGAARLFSIANAVALSGWVLLAIAPRRPLARLVAGAAIPGLLAATYTVLAITQLPSAHGGFGSLADVASLFAAPGVLLAGWVHYLAFDLLIGAWEVRDAERRRVPRWIVVPCLFATFMLGPAGLLLYVGVSRLAARPAPVAA